MSNFGDLKISNFVDPFNGYPENLKGKDISTAQKRWLAKLVIEDKKSAGEVARMFGLDRSTVSKYVAKVSKGTVMRDREGRPTLLDNLSMTEFHNFVTNVDVNRISEEEVKNFITESIRDSLLRKHGGLVNPDVKIPKHSVRNYVKRAMNIINAKREGRDVHI